MQLLFEELKGATKIVFAEFGLPKMVSDASMNFVSEKFKIFAGAGI